LNGIVPGYGLDDQGF